VKRWLAVVAGGFGLAAYLRRRRRRSAAAEVEPADELRAKLAESRQEQEPVTGAVETPASQLGHEEAPRPEEEPHDDLGERRRDVHERARQALDELR
jgi:hypothetical protein